MLEYLYVMRRILEKYSLFQLYCNFGTLSFQVIKDHLASQNADGIFINMMIM